MSDQKIIDLIKRGKHSKALDKLYKIYPAVKKHVTDYGGTETDAEDIFQDGLLIFIGKISNSDFHLSSSISTFVFGICKNLNRENIRQTIKKQDKEPELQANEYTKSIEEFLDEEQKYQELDNILIKLDEKCLEMLKMFYYQKLSMKIIATKLSFKSELSAKTQKYKCLEKARRLISSVFSKTKTIIS